MHQEISLQIPPDGGNPRRAEHIVQTGPDAFLLFPFSEDGNPNYKFRLEVCAANPGTATRSLDLEIEWDEPIHMPLRRELRIRCGQGDTWDALPMAADGTRTRCRIDLSPGESYLSLQPKYGYADHLAAVSRISESERLKKEIIGTTPAGRQIWMLHRTAGGPGRKRRVMLVARIHPYESAGSYCAQGILEYLASEERKGADLPNDAASVFLVPMAAVDGVADGHCRQNTIDGIDLSKDFDPADPVCAILKSAIDTVRPDIYGEIHNWMYPERDGIYHLPRLKAARFVRNMPSQKEYGKTWRPMLRRGFFPDPPIGLKRYCRKSFGSTVLCLEYPWSGRQPDDMKALGRATLHALCRL